MIAEPEPTADRRTFLKVACVAGYGACGGARRGRTEPTEVQRQWIATLLPCPATLDRDEVVDMLKRCSTAHYESLGMDAVLQRFRADLPPFLAFLREEWGWIIDHDPGTGIVLIDENRSHCVCPRRPAATSARSVSARRDSPSGRSRS